MKSLALSIVGLALLSGTALATEALPSLVTGGIAESGENAIEKIQENYNTKLVFTGDKGMYLADVEVSIRDNEGNEVVQDTSEGPFLLVQLTPGRYKVQAKIGGYTKTRAIVVGEHLKTYGIQFPIKDEKKSLSN